MPEFDSAHIAEWITAALLSLAGIAMGLRKLRVMWGSSAVEMAQNNAQESLITQLHAELTRMSAQNMVLATELNKLQLHILDLTKQVTLLAGENHSLRSEIASLRAEVSKLRSN